MVEPDEVVVNLNASIFEHPFVDVDEFVVIPFENLPHRKSGVAVRVEVKLTRDQAVRLARVLLEILGEE